MEDHHRLQEGEAVVVWKWQQAVEAEVLAVLMEEAAVGRQREVRQAVAGVSAEIQREEAHFVSSPALQPFLPACSWAQVAQQDCPFRQQAMQRKRARQRLLPCPAQSARCGP